MSVVLPGAEPFYFPGGRIGCLLVHGFTASPQEVRGLGEHLARAGNTVLGVRLAGHGTRWQDLAHTRWQDWYASVESGCHLLRGQCEQLFVLGMSTGGDLALILSTEYDLDGVVTMSAPYQLPPNPTLRLLYPFLAPLSTILPKLRKGPPDFRDPSAAAARVAYDCYPLRAVREFGLMLQALHAALPDVRVPVLTMHSQQDNFIPFEDMTRIHARLGSADKQMFSVVNSNHIVSSDAARRQVFKQAEAFIQRITNQER
jgi:carboxylesterase